MSEATSQAAEVESVADAEIPVGDSSAPATVEVSSEESTAPEKTPSSSTPAKGFDYGSWQGDMDQLPEDIREAVRYAAEIKGKQLEAGYTPKFQKLSEERSRFQEQQDAWADERKEIERELDILRRVNKGYEDPRLAEFEEKVKALSGEKQSFESQVKELTAKIEAIQQASDQEWFAQYKQRHSDVFEDPEMRKDLLSLSDHGWEEEAAAILVKSPAKVREAAEEIVKTGGLSPSAHIYAVELARKRLGVSDGRGPRQSAQVTDGSGSELNPTGTTQSGVRSLSITDARREAARRAAGVASTTS